MRDTVCSLNRHADQGAEGVDDGVFGFEGVAVGDDFGGFMDDADHGDEDRNERRRLPRPAGEWRSVPQKNLRVNPG